MGISGREEKCVLREHSGLKALGGGSFEEVVRPQLGNCSINTHLVTNGVLSRSAVFLGVRHMESVRFLMVVQCGAVGMEEKLWIKTSWRTERGRTRLVGQSETSTS
jgi:hypothetical protein